MKTNIILQGDALTRLKELPEKSINMVMTSPPYWALRDYGIDNQLGLEITFEEYIKKLCNIFDEIKRVLRNDGTIWINLGDTYYGSGAETQKNNVEPTGKQVYVMPYGSNRTRGWTRPSRTESYKAVSNKKCLYCGKEFKGRLNRNFCSKECLNKVGNDARTINRQLPDKCICMIPQRFSIEMINRGWILRNIIIWHKPNAMPSSVKDRFTVDFEYLFFFSKKKKYYFETQYEPHLTQEKRPDGIVRQRTYDYKGKYSVDNHEKFNSPRARNMRNKNNDGKGMVMPQKWNNPQGKNKRTVWKISTKPFKEAHFAIYPEKLCETPIKAGCPEEGIVLDPFFGSGTTGLVALKQGKKFIGIELNPEYIKIAEKRLSPFIMQSKLKDYEEKSSN